MFDESILEAGDAADEIVEAAEEMVQDEAVEEMAEEIIE